MGWRTIVVNAHSKLSYQGNHLVYRDAYRKEHIHLSEIDILLLETTDILISTMLIKRLVDEKILVIFCDEKRMPIANINFFQGKHDSSLQVVKQVEWSSEIKKKVWTEVISQKMMNQASLLLQLGFEESALSIGGLCQELIEFDPTNREGHAARRFFSTLYGNSFSRNQSNDINSGLNYGYMILLGMVAREIVSTGCITQLGLKHSNQFNPLNFASDLVEPFRVIVDRVIYENRGKDFSIMKIEILKAINQTYLYTDKEMYLTNIIQDYVKKTIKYLNNELNELPWFRV